MLFHVNVPFYRPIFPVFSGICTDFIGGKVELNTKKQKMDELNVDFCFETDVSNIPLEDADFIVLLGNLLDNSLAAVEKCKINNRKIFLSLRNINQMFIIKIKNTSISKPKLFNDRFITDKIEIEKHGWGIESVKYIVNQYNGHLTFYYDDTIFEVSIIINE